MTAYEVIVERGSAAALHAQPIPAPPDPVIRVQQITRPALVLGSNQDESVVDRATCEQAGIDIVRRRSGGGAVLLVPGEVTWFDVIVPRGTTGWDDDIHQPMIWLGRHLRDVLRRRTADEHRAVDVHEGAFQPTRWSSLLCFDGLGAGEITLGGHKLVGISQRRTRDAARLQCSWYSAFAWGSALALLAPQVRPAADQLGEVATVPAGSADDASVFAADLAAHLSDDQR